MSAFGSRWPAASAGVDAGTAAAGDAAFVVPVLFAPAFVGEAFVGEVFAGEVFAGAAFAAGFAAALAVAAAFAVGVFLAGPVSVLAVAALAVALPCPFAAAGFETAFADAFTGAFDTFATRSSSTILVRLLFFACAVLASELTETSSAAATMYCLYRRRCKSCPCGKGTERFAAENLSLGETWRRHLSASVTG